MNDIVSIEQTGLADEINKEHGLAQQLSETAVQHAIRCGQLLVEVKVALEHGQFEKWMADNCSFASSTARRYIQAAKQNATGVAISNLSGLFPSGRSGEKQRTLSKRQTPPANDEPDEQTAAQMASRLRAERAASDQGWLNRALEAAQYARYAPAETCPKTRNVVRAVKDVIAAWSAVLSNLNERDF
jgi:predicted GNAT family acetyltransferase